MYRWVSYCNYSHLSNGIDHEKNNFGLGDPELTGISGLW
ncbi:hypothetical protein VSF3289_03980 [Vibrio scophthalmi]|uniref:Uncharacterized protein n=1 Tax=Vibrio scophthalmi TaxID=45658 RepID=A0A1C7FGD0_9VIBR|nr:hypothetical protein VSVS05_03465 [Vibrio scophthalmi]ODS04841.1 hypothetical protein VSF3289_03980 [Vibrio scophthalmi]